jgi:hypothetical protein
MINKGILLCPSFSALSYLKVQPLNITFKYDKYYYGCMLGMRSGTFPMAGVFVHEL